MLNLFNSQKKKKELESRRHEKKTNRKMVGKKRWKRGSWDMPARRPNLICDFNFPVEFFFSVFFVILLADSHSPTCNRITFCLVRELDVCEWVCHISSILKSLSLRCQKGGSNSLVHMLPNYHSFVVKYKIFLNGPPGVTFK